jgi:hypothetical protein
MEVVIDPGHNIVRVRGVETFGREDILELLGAARGHDGARAYAVH